MIVDTLACINKSFSSIFMQLLMFNNEYKEKYSDTYCTAGTVSAVQIWHVENPEKQTCP